MSTNTFDDKLFEVVKQISNPENNSEQYFQLLYVPVVHFRQDFDHGASVMLGLDSNQNDLCCYLGSTSNKKNLIANNLKEDNEARLAALEAKVTALEAKVNENHPA